MDKLNSTLMKYRVQSPSQLEDGVVTDGISNSIAPTLP